MACLINGYLLLFGCDLSSEENKEDGEEVDGLDLILVMSVCSTLHYEAHSYSPRMLSQIFLIQSSHIACSGIYTLTTKITKTQLQLRKEAWT